MRLVEYLPWASASTLVDVTLIRRRGEPFPPAGESIADGVFTNEERQKLATIVRELRAPPGCVPSVVGIVVRAA